MQIMLIWRMQNAVNHDSLAHILQIMLICNDSCYSGAHTASHTKLAHILQIMLIYSERTANHAKLVHEQQTTLI